MARRLIKDVKCMIWDEEKMGKYFRREMNAQYDYLEDEVLSILKKKKKKMKRRRGR